MPGTIEELPGIAVPEYWHYDRPAVTRKMASQVAELERAGKADVVAHLGAGYPNPAVSCPLEDDAHFAAWLRFEADRRKMTLGRLLSSLRAYGPTEGIPEFRENFARLYRNDFGGKMDPAFLIPTNGATGGIDLVARAAAKYGKPIAVITDSPTYAGAIGRFRQDKETTRIYSVEMDSEGPIPEMFAEAVDQARKDGRFVAFYYTIPDGHNPAGISFSQKRRDQIYRICRDKDILLVEDAPYTYISFEPEESRPKPFFAADPDGRVIHLFTASKIWEPGERVGYMHVPSRLVTEDKRVLSFRNIILSISGGTLLFLNPTPFAFFNSLLHRRNGDGSFELSTLWDRARRKVQVYRENRSILLEGLDHYFGGHRDVIDWNIPAAGFFVVVRFKDAPFVTDGAFVEELLDKEKVTAIPMQDFFPPDAVERDPDVSNGALRLSFSYTRSADPDQRRAEIQKAVDRFGPAILRRMGKGIPPPMIPRSEAVESVATQAAVDVSAVFPPYNESRPSIDWSLADFFLQAVDIDTTSREGAGRRPSSPGQWQLAGIGASHLQQLGFKVAIDDKGNVMGVLESNLPTDDPAKALVPTYLLSAHMDTTSQVPFKDVRPHVVRNYRGGNIRLLNGLTLTPENTPSLRHCKGETIIVTDGTTGLGADNKGGYSAILEALRLLALDPSIPHGKVIVTFSTDEEVGGLDIPFGDATVGSTHDLERPNLVTVDTFDAFNGSVAFRHAQQPIPYLRTALVSTVRIEGVVTHPGDAFGKMIHAPEVSAELVTSLNGNMSTRAIKPVGIANDPNEQWMEISLALEPGNADQAVSLTAAIAAVAARYPGVKITHSRAAEPSAVDMTVAPLIQSASAFITGIPGELRPQNSKDFQPYIWPAKLVVEADGSVSIERMLFRAFDRSVNEENRTMVRRDLTAIEQAFPGVATDMSAEVAYGNMRSVIDQHPEVAAIIEEAIRANRLEPEYAPARGGTIGSNLALIHGIPAPNFGPGGFSEHSVTEGFSVHQGELTARIIVDVLQGWVNRARQQAKTASAPDLHPLPSRERETDEEAEAEPVTATEEVVSPEETEPSGEIADQPSVTGIAGPSPVTLAALANVPGAGLPVVARAMAL